MAARCAAIASAGAAAIHFAVAPMHWAHWVPSGVFFVSIGSLQLMWVFLIWSRPTALVLAIGIAANAGAVALWAHSRTGGAAFGPAAGQPEAVDAAGICVLLLQCYVIMGATWAWVRRSRAEQVSTLGRALVLLGANAVMVAAVTAGLASGLYGHNADHHGPAEARDDHQVAHDAPVPGHQHPTEPVGPPREEAMSGPATAPAPTNPGLPISESSLDTDGHHDHTH
ncbi:hypothetical protein GCM10023077_36340 [Mycolicibacterium helvum]